MVETIIDLKASNILLKKYKGGQAELRLFSTSRMRLAFRIFHPKLDKVLYLIGSSCKYICGPLRWNIANLFIDVITKEKGVIIINFLDEERGVKLIADGGFVLLKGTDLDFKEYLNDF